MKKNFYHRRRESDNQTLDNNIPSENFEGAVENNNVVLEETTEGCSCSECCEGKKKAFAIGAGAAIATAGLAYGIYKGAKWIKDHFKSSEDEEKKEDSEKSDEESALDLLKKEEKK